MYIIFFALLITIDVIILYYYRRNLRFVNFLFLSFMVCIAINVRETPDILNYIIRFNGDVEGHDYGYIVISKLFKSFGASYFEFQSWYYLVAISLIVIGTIRLSKYRLGVYVLYFVYPFLLNLVQIRNFMVHALLVLAVSLCYKEGKKVKQILLWVLLCLIAISQHYIGIVYLPFIFLYKKDKLLKISSSIGIILSVLIITLPQRFKGILIQLMGMLNDQRSSFYDSGASAIGAIFMILGVLVMALLIREFKTVSKEYVIESSILEDDQECTEKICFFEKLIIYSLTFCPFLCLNGNFYRIMQNEFIFIYIAFVSILGIRRKYSTSDNNSLCFKSGLVFRTLLFLAWMLVNIKGVWYDLFDSVVNKIL